MGVVAVELSIQRKVSISHPSIPKPQLPIPTVMTVKSTSVVHGCQSLTWWPCQRACNEEVRSVACLPLRSGSLLKGSLIVESDDSGFRASFLLSACVPLAKDGGSLAATIIGDLSRGSRSSRRPVSLPWLRLWGSFRRPLGRR